MKLYSIEGNTRKLDGGAMFARHVPVPRPPLCSGPPAASGFAPGESRGNALEFLA
ncbi:MAG TPA: hypothetical protein VJL61_14970 [Rhodanobacteraceae bacterium]|nr:hypothetical protein [Rhodanobacteraceae bacterium]